MEYWAKKKSGIFVIILILIQILIMCFFSAKKEGYHLDEIYSYELSNSTAVNSNYYGAIETNDKFGTDWIFGDEIKSYFVADEWERFAYDSVLTNQEADVHPPLYYLIFHTICSFFPGVSTSSPLHGEACHPELFQMRNSPPGQTDITLGILITAGTGGS